MRLSELGLEVWRDGSFDALGTCKHHAPGLLTFLDEKRYLSCVTSNQDVTCVVTTAELAETVEVGVVVAANPRAAFYRLHNLLAESGFYGQDFESEISPHALIDPRAIIAPRNVIIGAAQIEAGAVILPGAVLDDTVIVGAGCVVSGPGFEFKRIEGGVLPVAHAGGVHLAPGVELQANTHVARSVFGGQTEIGEDAKIDALVHVAHNARIGRRCLIAAHAMIAGSATLGDDVWIGPGACVSSEVTIGDGGRVSIGAVAVRDVAPGQTVSGNFAIDHKKLLAWIKTVR